MTLETAERNTPDRGGYWTLLALRRSAPGDPTGPDDTSRFVYNTGPPDAIVRQYAGYAQPTEIILAEVRDHDGRVLMRFDRVAEAVAKAELLRPQNLAEAAGEAALGDDRYGMEGERF